MRQVGRVEIICPNHSGTPDITWNIPVADQAGHFRLQQHPFSRDFLKFNFDGGVRPGNYKIIPEPIQASQLLPQIVLKNIRVGQVIIFGRVVACPGYFSFTVDEPLFRWLLSTHNYMKSVSVTPLLSENFWVSVLSQDLNVKYYLRRPIFSSSSAKIIFSAPLPVIK